MRAMILAAGRGERMRPLSDRCPKPLLVAGGRPLIEHLILALAAAGVHELVINLAWLGGQLRAALGSGAGLGVSIRYSEEPPGALESGGGVRRALPLLGDEPFLVVNGDLWTDFPFASLPRAPAGLAHLVLVPNPEHHRQGDFALCGGRVRAEGAPRFTYAGIGVYRRALFEREIAVRFPLAPLLRRAARADRISGEIYTGGWMDVGTPQRLAALDALLGGTGHADPGRT